MQYVTKKCPHCRKPLSVMKPANIVEYGQIITKCQFCGGLIIDKSVKEAALDTDSAFDIVKPIYFSTVFYAFGLIILGFTPLLLFNDSVDLWKVVLLIITISAAIYFAIKMVVDDYKKFDSRLEEMENEIEESRNRLLNYKYALTLKQYGYSIPDEFLDPKDLSYYNSEFKKRFGDCKHPYTWKMIETAQEYLDAVDSQRLQKRVITEKKLSVKELNDLFKDRFKDIPNIEILNMDDYLKALDEHAKNNS